uniref:HTH_Tnp_Tc3_2 domain-containing protein n=1 Tax=Heterorhabditis bacteriophora TaxID=37862 RepID=A0A1I7W6N9_HETBA
MPTLLLIWDARKCSSFSKKAKHYRKDRLNNPSANLPLIARVIHKEIKAYRECSLNVGLNERIARKKPLARVESAREHLTWSTADWTSVQKCVRRQFMPKCTILTIKHDGGLVMMWAAFNRNGPGPLHIVEGIIDSTSYSNLGNKKIINIENTYGTMYRGQKVAQISVQRCPNLVDSIYQEFRVSYKVLIMY